VSATAPAVPLASVVSDPKQVFLIWSAVDSGYLEATDTFIFDDDFKISRQNIALYYKQPNQAAELMEAGWDNHFAAFGMGVAAQDDADPTNGNTAALDKIMLDYDDTSVVRLYDYSAAEPKLTTFDTLADIRAMFDGLFPALKGCNGAADDQLKAQTVVDGAGMQVFLVWRCARASFFRATDTFIFDGGIIKNQNIVVSKTEKPIVDDVHHTGPGKPALLQFGRSQDDYNPTSESEAWANHADAFMAGSAAGGLPTRDPKAKAAALDKIMLDYIEESVVRLYSFDQDFSILDNTFDEKKGMTEIRTMFSDLFDSMASPIAPAVPQALVVNDPKQVFLIWSAVDSGYKEATDTFIFDDDFKISRQNIALG